MFQVTKSTFPVFLKEKEKEINKFLLKEIFSRFILHCSLKITCFDKSVIISFLFSFMFFVKIASCHCIKLIASLYKQWNTYACCFDSVCDVL